MYALVHRRTQTHTKKKNTHSILKELWKWSGIVAGIVVTFKYHGKP